MAVFISSHILSEVQTLCDRVAFINHGEIKSVEDIKLHSITTKLESISVITKDNVVLSLIAISRIFPITVEVRVSFTKSSLVVQTVK